MIRIRIIFAFLFTITLISCQNKKTQIDTKQEVDKINKKIALDGHTYFRITETDSGKILYQPCDAKIATYKFYKDSIYHNWGQEYDVIKQIEYIEEENSIIGEGYNTNSSKKEKINIHKLSKNNFFWKINEEIFIDSLDISKIPYVRQSKKDCEDIISLELMLKKEDNTWSNNCELNDSYIYFSSVNGIDGRIVSFIEDYTIKISNKIISENQINILFKSPIHPPYPDNMSDFLNYSEEDPIAKITKNEDNLELLWLGFYNKKTGKRENLENPFTGKVEKSSIILKKCQE